MSGNGWYLRVMLALSTAFWFGIATVDASNSPAGGFLELMFLFFSGCAIAFVWFIYTFAWPGVVCFKSRTVVWLAIPAAPFVSMVGYSSGWSMAVRVWLVEPQLRAIVEEPDQDEFSRGPSRAGLFTITDVSRHHSAVLLTTRYGFFTRGGIAFLPERPTEDWHGWRLTLTHLYGPWYRFVDHSD